MNLISVSYALTHGLALPELYTATGKLTQLEAGDAARNQVHGLPVFVEPAV